MDQFARTLRQIAGGYITAPVQNKTGLEGYWDFDVAFTPFQVLQRAGADAITLFAMIEQQLGLKLDQGSVPTPVFVVDSVNAEPTPNPSGVSAAIPSPPPMEFDVAVIKLSQPDTQPRTRLLPGGRIEGDGITMQPDHAARRGTSPPTSWSPTRRNGGTRRSTASLAKTSTAVSGAGQDTNVDIDDLKAMLRQLITERFQLKSHYEERPVTAYTLLADKPKMAKADPANRTGFREGPAPGQRDQRNAIIGRMVTVRNMSMPQFAEDLQRIAGGYIRVPVEDQTGLEGSYDFTLSFTRDRPPESARPRTRRRRRSRRRRRRRLGSNRWAVALRRGRPTAGSEARDAQAPDEGARDRLDPGEAGQLILQRNDRKRGRVVPFDSRRGKGGSRCERAHVATEAQRTQRKPATQSHRPRRSTPSSRSTLSPDRFDAVPRSGRRKTSTGRYESDAIVHDSYLPVHVFPPGLLRRPAASNPLVLCASVAP